MRSYEKRLKVIIRRQQWLMRALDAVRTLNLPDWYVAAGAIRNTVWDYLHGYEEKTSLNDVDVVYFDSSDLEGRGEKEAESHLKLISRALKWEVTNQARGHLFQREDEAERPQVNSSCESIAYWSETPTCVGVRLEKNDFLTVCSPHGLADLFEMRVRPVPPPYEDLRLYRRRMQEKKWGQKWPKLDIETH